MIGQTSLILCIMDKEAITISVTAEPLGGDAPEGVSHISSSHTAGTTVTMQGIGSTPSTTLSPEPFFMSKADRVQAIEKTWQCHEALDEHLGQGLQNKLAPNVMTEVSKVAHQVLVDLLRGNMAMRIDAEELAHLFDTIRDNALLYINSLKPGDSFCAHTLKNHIMNHPAVQDFKEMYDPRHGHNTHMKYHPKTGMQSSTALASHISHHGMVEEHEHGNYIGSHSHE